MKIPIPPSGGQGGHYGGGAPARTRMFNTSPKFASRGYVPRRLRGLRLRRPRRSRITQEHPMMTMVAIALAAVPVLLIVGFVAAILEFVYRLLA